MAVPQSQLNAQSMLLGLLLTLPPSTPVVEFEHDLDLVAEKPQALVVLQHLASEPLHRHLKGGGG